VNWDAKGGDAASGGAHGVDDRGNLIVELDDGERLTLGSGEVSLRVGGS
jgi:biotin-(acetyl-CoA carboxylase) ligase